MDLDAFCGYLFRSTWHELTEEAERRKLKSASDNSKVRVSVKNIISALRR